MRIDQSTPPGPAPAREPGVASAPRSRWRLPRETRLLILTIAVSVAALLVLARFRFPEQVPIVNPSPPPLEQLAARATYDELADIIAQLQARIEPGLVVLHASTPPDVSRTAELPPAGSAMQFISGVRIDDDLVLARLTPAERLQSVVGSAVVPVVLARDPLRQLALIRIPRAAGGSGPHWLREAPASVRVPGYFAVAEGGRGGVTIRPLFVSRLDPLNDPRWDRPLLAMGGFADPPPGSFIFTLEGSLVGMVVDDEGMRLVVPRASLEQSVTRLTSGPLPVPGVLGIDVQPLTPALAAATGAQQGLIVARVDDGGPAASVLRFGDVIQAVNGNPTYSREEYEHRLSTVAAGDAVALTILRGGQSASVTITARAAAPAAAPAPAGNPATLGLSLLAARGVGAQVVRVLPGSAAAHAGIQPGDVITRIGDAAAPAPDAIAQAFRRADSQTPLLVGLLRQDQPLVLVLTKP